MRLTDCKLRSISTSNCPSSFECGTSKGQKDLSDFILTDALKYQEHFTGTTKLVFFENEIIGFFTLAASEIKLKESERSIKNLKVFPSLKLARFAIQSQYQGKGLGKDIIKFVVGLVIQLNVYIGCRFILVDALPESTDFYRKLGFEENLTYKKRDLPSLRLDIFHDILFKI